MSNELLTREDIVRAKQNVDAYDKYLDGDADETVKLPSGKVIKTRAAIEKELTDKFPDSKAGLRDVGNGLGEIPVMTNQGIGVTGMGSTFAIRLSSSNVSKLTDANRNAIYAIPSNLLQSLPDAPTRAPSVMQTYAYDDNLLMQMAFSSDNKIFIRTGQSMRGDGNVSEWGELYHSKNPIIYNTSTGTASNVVVTRDGELQRTTSSRVFKQDIKPIDINGYREKLKAMQPVSYRSKHNSDPEDWTWYSFIAEDLMEVDPHLVQMSSVEFYEELDEDGKATLKYRDLPEGEYAPEGLHINAIVTMLTRINQYMLDDIEALEAEKTQLKSRMTKLENRLESLEKKFASE